MAEKIIRVNGRFTKRSEGAEGGNGNDVGGESDGDRGAVRTGEGSNGEPDEPEVGKSYTLPGIDIGKRPEPDSYGGEDGTPQPRKRGRPKGSKGKSKQAQNTTDLKSLEDILLIVHDFLAHLTKMEELKIEPEEAHEIREGAEALAREYPITGVSAKTLAWIKFSTALGKVYATRAVVIRDKMRDRKRQQAEASRAQRPGPVPMPQREPPKKQQAAGEAFDFYPPARPADIPDGMEA